MTTLRPTPAPPTTPTTARTATPTTAPADAPTSIPTPAPTGPTGPTGRRRADVALWVLQGLLALVYAGGAVPKVTTRPDAVAGFADLGIGTAGMVLIGVLELAGAVALLVPRLCGLAALAFVGLMTGAVALTVLRLDPADAILPAALLVLVAVVARARRHRTAALLAGLRR